MSFRYLHGIALTTLLGLSPLHPAFAAPQKITVTSKSITKGGVMGAEFGCSNPSRTGEGGSGYNPQLTIGPLPKSAKSIAIIGYNKTDKTYLWARYNISPKKKTIHENTWGGYESEISGYFGPCPAIGQTHSVVFYVYALNQVLKGIDDKYYSSEHKPSFHKDLTKGVYKKNVVASGSIAGRFTLNRKAADEVFDEFECTDDWGYIWNEVCEDGLVNYCSEVPYTKPPATSITKSDYCLTCGYTWQSSPTQQCYESSK